jgi:hypothetical protein
MSYADKLKESYERRRASAEARFPGSVIAGPARYPVARHEKAWAGVRKAHDEWQKQANKERRSAEHAAAMESNRQQTDEIAAAMGIDADWNIGDRARLYWTNCGNRYTAIVEVVKLNARTVKIKLADDVPEGYPVGQSWAVAKIGTDLNRLERLP